MNVKQADVPTLTTTPEWCKQIPIPVLPDMTVVGVNNFNVPSIGQLWGPLELEGYDNRYVCDDLINRGYLYRPGDVLMCWNSMIIDSNFAAAGMDIDHRYSMLERKYRNIYRIEACLLQMNKVNGGSILRGYVLRSLPLDYKDCIQDINSYQTPSFELRPVNQDILNYYVNAKYSGNMIDDYGVNDTA